MIRDFGVDNSIVRGDGTILVGINTMKPTELLGARIQAVHDAVAREELFDRAGVKAEFRRSWLKRSPVAVLAAVQCRRAPAGIY